MANYKTMNKAELKALAEDRNVEVAEDATNKEIAEALEKADEANGADTPKDSDNSSDGNVEPVNDAPVVTGDESDKKEDAPADEDKKVVVKYTGRNPSYMVANIKFTRDHPFHTVRVALCEYLVSTGDFAEADADEVAEYYK